MVKTNAAYAAWLATAVPVFTQVLLAEPDNDKAWLKLRKLKVAARRIGDNPLGWYLMEEIGWPEGMNYFARCLCGPYDISFIKRMRRCAGEAAPEAVRISPRLDNRRRHWKTPAQEDFIAAHTGLLGLAGLSAGGGYLP